VRSLAGLAVLFLAGVVLSVIALLLTAHGFGSLSGTERAGQPPLPGTGDTNSGGRGQPVSGVECHTFEQFAYHVHAHLFIYLDGVGRPVPALIGIPGGQSGFASCYYWLHTHDQSGIIHIESPDRRTFTLGQFFDVWGEPLGRTQVTDVPVPDGEISVFLDGREYGDNPRQIGLHNHTDVVIEIGSHRAPPSAYCFPTGY
jgi:hypothetical protein